MQDIQEQTNREASIVILGQAKASSHIHQSGLCNFVTIRGSKP